MYVIWKKKNNNNKENINFLIKKILTINNYLN